MEIRRGIQAAASEWRKVEEVMGDRHISRKLKGKMLTSCKTPAYLYHDDDKKQPEKLQVCENNWVRRIAGAKRINKRRMEELREDVGVKESHGEAGGEPAKVRLTCGNNGRGTADEVSCA